MITQQENNDDDSFIILGTSPGTSLDIKCNGIENGSVSLDKEQIEEAMKDLSMDANMALKAHFNIGECPSPSSMMVASTIVTEDSSTEELQKRFGELLDENVILKETLKQNNDSMKEQFLLIASCQEDMMKTHVLHKEKFEETKELVEKLRQENKKLKQDVARLAEKETSIVNSETSESVISGSSALEFVTSPDDDTINKLTAQLELVEKQRRQVIVDNEKLTWQKESLEHIVDATSKERDDLREKLKDAELQLSTKDTDYGTEIQNLKHIIQDLTKELQSQRSTFNVSSEELTQRDTTIHQLQAKVSILQSELKKANLKILELESVKLEFSKHKSGVSESMRTYKEQIQDLQARLTEVSTIVFQPVRFSISSELENSSSEDASLTSNVNLYDRTLKYLAELMNKISHGISDSLVETLGVVVSLYEYKLERTTVEQFRSALGEVKRQLETQHSTALNNIAQVRGALSIFEGIFKDYNELVKKVQTKQKLERPSSAANIDALTAALVARGQELQAMEAELNKLKNVKEDRDLMKEQMDLYKSDFEAEREAREKMASEKENILTELRTAQRRNKELKKQLEEGRNKNLTVDRNVVSSSSSSNSMTASGKPAHWLLKSPAENMVYTCPKCLRFSCDQYKSMEEHFDFCLDDF